MTAEKLVDLLTLLESTDKKTALQSRLEAVKESLTQLVSQPATPQYQSKLADALAALDNAAAQLQDALTPSQRAMVEVMGGAEAFDPSIAQRVRGTVEKNAMTPAVAEKFVSEIAERRSQFLTAVRGAQQNLRKLQITASVVSPGSADLAFLIPRELFKNQLDPFAKELVFISRLLQHITEGLTGQAEDVQLEDLSSSIPTIALIAKAKVISTLADIVNKFLQAWEKVQKIRKMRADMKDMGIEGAPLDVLE